MNNLNKKIKITILSTLTFGMFLYYWLKEQNILNAVLAAIFAFFIMILTNKLHNYLSNKK